VTASGRVVPIASHSPEALRLLLDFEREARRVPGIEWLAPDLAERAAAMRRGESVDGFLLVGPSDEAVGIALGGTEAETGIVIHPYLAEGFRTAATLDAFLRALGTERPVRVVHEPIFGVPEGELTALLGGLGFHRIVRADMGFAAERPLPEVPDDPNFPLRALSAEDAPALARLMARSYDDNLDDRALFQRWRDPAEDARRSIGEILGAGLGTWRPDASFGVPVPGGLAAATIVNDLGGPLISEVMTDPDWRRRGFARRSLRASVAAVRSAGLGAPRLVVNLGNHRAHRLYESFGFVVDPRFVGGLWVRPSALAAPPGPG
jgi:ribosomal protein S18 acetylase RimI-like enzyme